jgi:hypothetical protein
MIDSAHRVNIRVVLAPESPRASNPICVIRDGQALAAMGRSRKAWFSLLNPVYELDYGFESAEHAETPCFASATRSQRPLMVQGNLIHRMVRKNVLHAR